LCFKNKYFTWIPINSIFTEIILLVSNPFFNQYQHYVVLSFFRLCMERTFYPSAIKFYDSI
jgi:hypothetical protein